MKTQRSSNLRLSNSMAFPSTGIFTRLNGACRLAMLMPMSVLGTDVILESSDIPSRTGTVNLAYATGVVKLDPWITKTGLNQFWDFSVAQTSSETTQRTEIVATSDGENGGGFGEAAFAERVTASDGRSTWSYYAIDPHLGRVYYGFYNPNTEGGSASVPFLEPTVDLPTPLSYGSSWRRGVDYQSLAGVSAIASHVEVVAKVDGSGILKLPLIGEVPALRVFEVRTTSTSVFGSPLLTQYTTNLYWLSPGIGKAVDLQVVTVKFLGGGDLNLGVPTESALGYRTFSASGLPIARVGFSTKIKMTGPLVRLEWDPLPGINGYEIQASATNPSGPWQVVATVRTNQWSSIAETGHLTEYFRILSVP